MASIGETLRDARMRQRLDIAEVERSTKIRAKYLRALENEDFAVLPGPTFVKTFLRTYSEVLGLDPHVLVEEYRANYEPRDELDVQPISSPPSGERGWRPGPPGRGMVIGLVIVGFLAFLIVLGLTGEEGAQDGGEEAASRTDAAKRERQRTTTERRPRPPPAAVALKVTPEGPVYVCLDRGPGTDILFEGTLTEPRSFRGKKLRINLGRTAVDMQVNGKPFPVEQVGNPVGYEFSSTGSKQLPTGQRPCA